MLASPMPPVCCCSGVMPIPSSTILSKACPLRTFNSMVARLAWPCLTIFCKASCAIRNKQWEISDVPSHFPSDISHCLFRIAQEALQNIVKHGHASLATMELKVRSGHALLRIVDDGIGMTPEQQQTGGMGLASMCERVCAFDGMCKVTSGPLKGTTVDRKSVV